MQEVIDETPASEGLVDGLFDGTSRPDVRLPVAPHRHKQRKPVGYVDEGMIDGLLDGLDAPATTLIPLVAAAGVSPTSPILKGSNYQFLSTDSGSTFEFNGPNPPNGASAVFGWVPPVNPGSSWTATIENTGYLPFVLVAPQIQTTGTTHSSTSVTAMPSSYGIDNEAPGNGLVGMSVTGLGVQAGTVVEAVATLSATGTGAITLSLATTSSLTGTPLTFSGPMINGGYEWVVVTAGQKIVVTSDGTNYYTELLTPLPYTPPGSPGYFWCAFNGPALGPGTQQAQPYTGYSFDGLSFTTIDNPAFTNSDTQTISGVTYPLFARDCTIFKSPIPNADGSRRWWMTFSEGPYSAFSGSAWVPSSGTGRNLEAIPSGCTNTRIGIAYSDSLAPNSWHQVTSIDFSAYFTANSIPFNNVFSTLGIFCDGVDFWLSVCWYKENTGTNVFPFPCFPVTFGQGTMTVNTSAPAATAPLGWIPSASYPAQLNNYDPCTGLWHRLSTVYDTSLGGSGTFAGHSVSTVGPSSPSSYAAVNLGNNLPDDFDGGSVVRLPNGTWRFYAGIDVSSTYAYQQFAYYWTSPDLYNWVGATYSSPPATGPNSYWVTFDGGGTFDDTEQPLYSYGKQGTIRWNSNGGGGDGYDPDAHSALANYWASQQAGSGSDSTVSRFFN